MIDYTCPKCGVAMGSPDSMAGQNETCPECGNVTVVPSPASLPSIPSLAAGGLGESAPSSRAKPASLIFRPVFKKWRVVDVIVGLAVSLAVVLSVAYWHHGREDAEIEQRRQRVKLEEAELLRKRMAQEKQLLQKVNTQRATELAAKRKVIEEKLAGLSKQLHVSWDKGVGRAFASPAGLTCLTADKKKLYFHFYVGIGAKGRAYLLMSAYYIGEDWLFVDSVIFMVDGKRIDVPISRFRDVDTETKWSSVQESINTVVKPTLPRIVGDGKEVYVTLGGRTRRQTWQLTDANLWETRCVLKFYDCLEEASSLEMNAYEMASKLAE